MTDTVIQEWTDEKEGIHHIEIPLTSFLMEHDYEPMVRCKNCVYCKRFNDVWYMPKKK